MSRTADRRRAAPELDLLPASSRRAGDRAGAGRARPGWTRPTSATPTAACRCRSPTPAAGRCSARSASRRAGAATPRTTPSASARAEDQPRAERLASLALRPRHPDAAHRLPVPHQPRLGALGPRLAEHRQAQPRAARRPGRDRLARLPLHDELALHPRRHASASRRASRSPSSPRSRTRSSTTSSRWSAPIEADPALKAAYEARASGRSAFNAGLAARDPETVAQGWQRHYVRGEDAAGRRPDFHRHQAPAAEPDGSARSPATGRPASAKHRSARALELRR